MRVVVILLWVLLLLAVLLPLMRRVLSARSRPAALRDELVKDPVCQTYVLRSRAVRARTRGEPVYCCSPDCARQFEQAGG
jgi:YHS domain-containing protein